MNVDIDIGDIATALAGVGGAGALAVASAPIGVPEDDLPRGPARRAAETIISGLNDIEGLDIMGTEMQRTDWILEFHVPDRDTEYPSVIALDRDTGRLTEITLRFGPLGDQAAVDDSEWRELEGAWTDVVLDSASTAGILSGGGGFDPDTTIDGRNIDLGDKWVSDQVRPHVRMGRKDDGYDVSPRELVRFVEALDERFESQFGTFEERRFSPEFRDNFIER
jgi:hypothetical protein